MKNLLVVFLLFSLQSICPDSNQKVTRYWFMTNPSIPVCNGVKSASYFFRMLPYLYFADEHDGKDESDEAHFFLVCLNCNAIVSAEEIFTEVSAKMFYAVSNQNLFQEYCKLMDKALNQIKNKDYKMFISCSLDGAILAKRACRLCNKISWKVMQKKEIDFTKVISDRA